ncbi:MAG: hypothetical protein QNJ53_23570 [Pleurocapsa sp. MO_192.B19]|nr:hypothetical protein [Pleurocapsa sp. MO_192.B19]
MELFPTDCRLTAAVDTRVKPRLGKASVHSDRFFVRKAGYVIGLNNQ